MHKIRLHTKYKMLTNWHIKHVNFMNTEQGFHPYGVNKFAKFGIVAAF